MTNSWYYFIVSELVFEIFADVQSVKLVTSNSSCDRYTLNLMY